MSLLISQAVDHATNTGARYVELFNTSQFALDLSGYRLLRYSDGATTPSATMTLSGVVLPGGTFVITAAGAAFSATFGVAASTSSGAINGDGDDVYQLVQMVGGNPVAVDTFGVVGEVPAAGTSWNYLDSVATRVLTVGAPNATWTASEWTITPGTAAANPFTHAFDLNSAPTFAVGDGIVTTAVGNSDDFGLSVAVQPDGKILLGGYSYNLSDGDRDFALARYNFDGWLDTTFGVGGRVVTPVGSSWDYAFSVTVQSDGKILLGGFSDNGNYEDFALVRYDADGSLDTSFGVGGKVVTPVGGFWDSAFAVAVQPDGKILLGGRYYSANGSNEEDFALARYNTDGTLDASFGDGDGIATTPIGFSDTGISVTIQPDGKILLGGYSASGSNGFASNDFALVRYNTNGALDASFGVGGKVVTPVGSSADLGSSVTIQSDGKILLGGYSQIGSNYDFVLVRYNSNGTLDASFGGGDGIVTTPVGTSSDFAISVTLQPDGKILLGGYSQIGNNNDFALVRYNSNGTLDTSFGGGDGIVTTPVGTSSDVGASVTVQPDGKILLGGISAGSSGDLDFALVRYNADGSLDLSFDGVNTLNGAATFNEGGAAVVLDGSALVYDSELATAASGGNYGGASVTLQRQGTPDATDTFSGANGLSFGGEGSAVTLNGSTIGTVTTNGGGVLVLTFAAGATQAQVNDALSRIAYANTSDLATNSNTPIQIAWTFSDGAAVNPQSTTGTTTVNLVGSTNTPPAVTELDATHAGVTEQFPPVQIDANVAIFDADYAALGDYTGLILNVGLAAASSDNGSTISVSLDYLNGLGLGEFALLDDPNEPTGRFVTLDGADIAYVVQGAGLAGHILITFAGGAGAVTQAMVDAVARSLHYSYTGDVPPDQVELAYTVDDGDGPISGFTIVVPITAVDDAPVLADPANIVVGEQAINAAPVLLAPTATFTDADGYAPGYGGSRLVVTMANFTAGEDLLWVRNEGTAAGQVSISSSVSGPGFAVLYGGAIVGFATYLDTGLTPSRGLQIYFNTLGAPVGAPTAQATPEIIQAVLNNLTYQNTSDTPRTTNTFTVTFDYSQIGLPIAPLEQTFTLQINAENDAPTVTVINRELTEFSVNIAPTPIGMIGTIADGEGNWDGGSLRVAGGLAEDMLSVSDVMASGVTVASGVVYLNGVAVGTVAGGSAGSDLVITFNANSSTAAINAVADAIHVFNASDNPTSTRTLSVTITDGDGATDVETAVLAITPQNDFATVTTANPSAVLEAIDASAQTIVVAGSLEITDPDIGGTITPSLSAFRQPEILLNGSPLPTGLELSAMLSGLTFSTAPFGTGISPYTLFWSYESTASLDFLAEGDSLTLTYWIRLSDNLNGNVAIFDTPITVTITGTDDAPIAANHTWSIGSNSPFGVTAAEGLLAEGDPDRGDAAHLTKINGVEMSWTTANPNESRTIDLAGDGSAGLLTVYQNGRYVYDPAGAYDPLTSGSLANPAPSFAFTLADIDGSESVGTITFNVNGVDDQPVVTFTPIVVAETSDPGTVLARIAFFDPEGADVSIAVTDATGNVTASPFSLVQNVNGAWQLILDNPTAIDFEEASSGTGSIGLYLTLNDGTTGPQTHFVSVQVANVNEAPTLTDLVDVSAPTPAFMEDDATPVLIAGPGASISDPDFIQDVTEFGAAVTLTIARVGGADANDMLGLDFFDSGLDNLYEVDGGDIWSLDDEDTIGTFEYVDGTLTITFNGGVPATPAIVSDILRSVTYAYNADFAIRQTVELAVTFNDQGYSFDSSSGDFVADPHEVTGIIAVDLVPINEAPAGADKIVSIGEDATYTLTVADFGYTDPNHDPFGGVYIEALPLSGDLFVDSNGNGAADAGETVTAAQTISDVDIAAGRLKYVSALHESGNPYSSFRFSVIDDLGASSLEARTITFNVNAVNDIPTIGGVATGAVVESGGVGNVTAGSPNTTGSLAIVDPDAGESTFRTPASLAGVYGAFTFNPATGAWSYQLDNARSTTEALRAGQMVHDLLTVTSFDGTATRTIDVTITGANDAPTVAAAISLGVTAAQPITITQAQLLSSAGDVDDGTVLQVNALSADSGTVDDHGDGTWLFTPTDGFVGPVTFSYFVHDSIATTTGSALLSVVDDSPAHTILWNTSADPATINGTTGFDTLRVVDGALPTSFDLVGHGFEAARYETGDTNGEPWATSVRSYDALWNLKQWYVTYDNGSAIRFGYDGAERLDWVQEYGASGVLERYTDYDQVPGSGNTWASFYNLYDPVSGMQTQKYVTYDDGSSLRQGYDTDGRIDWLQEYNAAGVLVRYTDYDQAPESGNGWSSFYNLYDGTSGLLAQRFFTYDDGTTLRQGYDSHGHLDWQEERRADSSLAYYTDWDQEDLETWASFVNVYDGTGAFVSRAYHLDI